MDQISFFKTRELVANCKGPKIVNICERGLNLRGQIYICDSENNTYPITNKSPCWKTGLKILALATLVIPFLLLIGKIIGRCKYSSVENTPWDKPLRNRVTIKQDDQTQNDQTQDDQNGTTNLTNTNECNYSHAINNNNNIIKPQPHTAIRPKKEDGSTLYGTRSQFKTAEGKDDQNGRSACTFTATEAANTLINMKFEDVTSDILDEIVNTGINNWKTWYVSEENVNKVEHSGIKDTNPYAKNLTPVGKNELFLINPIYIDSIITYTENPEFPLAIVIVKAPETSCIIQKSKDEFWLFDSHGKTYGEKKTYLTMYTSRESFLEGLKKRFPFTPTFGDYEEINVADIQKYKIKTN